MKTIFLAAALGIGLLGSAGLYAADAPAGATAQCKDGTYSTATSHKGACKGHDGVKTWLDTSGTAAPAAATPKPAAAAAPAKTTAASTAASSGTGTPLAKCKDGTTFNGTSHRGACKGHQGVDQWLDTPATTSTTAATSNGAAMTKPAPAPAPAPAAKPAPAATSAATKTAPTPSSEITQKPGGGAGKVWVNSSSNVYHCQDDQWYGKTKEGSYMTEAAAKAAGARAARGKECGA